MSKIKRSVFENTEGIYKDMYGEIRALAGAEKLGECDFESFVDDDEIAVAYTPKILKELTPPCPTYNWWSGEGVIRNGELTDIYVVEVEDGGWKS